MSVNVRQVSVAFMAIFFFIMIITLFSRVLEIHTKQEKRHLILSKNTYRNRAYVLHSIRNQHYEHNTEIFMMCNTNCSLFFTRIRTLTTISESWQWKVLKWGKLEWIGSVTDLCRLHSSLTMGHLRVTGYRVNTFINL